MADRYLQPGWFTRDVFHRLVAGLTRIGLRVDLLAFEHDRYLVAPRGDTQWVRNLRASAGEGVLLLGRSA